MKRNSLLLGLLMGGAALNSAALTVGRIRGAAWIGQPLSLSVPVQLDSSTSDAALCAEADVYYADALQDPARVRVQQTPGPQGGTQIVQINSAITIDEPMVTVYLRVGCGQKVSRRYVMLADYPSVAASTDASTAVVDAVATSAAIDAPNPVVATALVDTPPSPVADTAAPRAEATTTTSAKVPPTRKIARSAPAPQKAASTQGAAPKPAAQAPANPRKRDAAPVVAPAAPQRARLKLDPLENLSERIKTLETTTTAIPLEDMVRDAQRIQQLQGDVKKLLDQAAKNEASLAQMRERLDKAEAERVSTTWIYALAALVLACLAAISVLWNRRSPAAAVQQGWSASQSEDEDDPPLPKPHPTVPAPVTTTPAPVTAVLTPQKESPAGVDLLEMDVDADAYVGLIHPAPTLSASASPSAPAPLLETETTNRDFNSESQFDLRQQAVFFDGLGKTNEAIELLEKRIRTNSKDCPLIYLELLRIANTRSLKTDFRQFRDECMQAFNVAVPEFALFRSEGRTLETYPDLLAHIEKLWDSPKVLEVLESCILRDPWEKNAKPFDLAAFKELVKLHGLASRSEPMPSAAQQQQPTDGKKDNTELPDSLGIDLEL